MYLQIVFFTISIFTFIYFIRYFYGTKQALQWWYSRQSIKLSLEAENIRDSLLQESFTMRRRLELLPVDSITLSHTTQEHLQQINNFHQSLTQLSDRLSPAYIQDSLPLAIQSLLKLWVESHPDLDLRIDMPKYWRHEPAERSLIILKTLEELLRISLSNLVQLSIYLSLKQHEDINQLVVQFTYPDIYTLIFHSQKSELNYLCKSFRFLTSGKCFYRSQKANMAWYFYW
ncbi:MAG: hypothetical protein PUP91_33600 [Rhizonema sp. PD37]|nr:hypothetical protein [Rhizonema sp. PD37]